MAGRKMENEPTDKMDIELIKKKVAAHFENNFLIHCAYNSGAWKNGTIIEVSADFFILDELFEGKMPIFYQELRKVETYSPRGKK